MISAKLGHGSATATFAWEVTSKIPHGDLMGATLAHLASESGRSRGAQEDQNDCQRASHSLTRCRRLTGAFKDASEACNTVALSRRSGQTGEHVPHIRDRTDAVTSRNSSNKSGMQSSDVLRPDVSGWAAIGCRRRPCRGVADDSGLVGSLSDRFTLSPIHRNGRLSVFQPALEGNRRTVDPAARCENQKRRSDVI